MTITAKKATAPQRRIQPRSPDKTTDTSSLPERQAVQHGTSASVAVVPDKAILKQYIPRKIGDKSEFDIFDFALASKLNVLIEGPTGPGKTMATRAYAASRDMPLARIPSNVGIEPSQLFGKYLPTAQGGFQWFDGPVTHVVRHGGVLLINEVNFMPERVSTVLFGLLDGSRQITLLDHKGEVIDASEDLLVVADMNPEYEGTRPLNKAFRNRFSIQMFWDYDPVVERKLVQMPTLLDIAQRFRAEQAKGTYETPVSTNMLMEFERVVVGLGYDFAVANFVTHFAKDERDPARLVFSALEMNLKRDLAKMNPPEKVDENDENYWPDENRPEGWKEGDVDPIWGVYGTEWSFEEIDEEG